MLHRIIRPALVESKSNPILVLLHGLGSSEEDLMGIAPELDPRLTVVAYRAPLVYGPGYSWFDIEWTDTGILFDERQAASSLAMLLAEFRGYSLEFGECALYLGGFSQGAAMTFACVLTEADLFAGALMLSGRMSRSVADRNASTRLDGMPCLVQHGTLDPVIPVASGREMRDELVSRGADVEFREYPMGHQVSYESLLDIKDWFAARL